MDIKHSDPKLSVEEAWLTMTIVYIWQSEIPLPFDGRGISD